MSHPWFRPYARFSYRPVTWEGRAVLAAMVTVFIALGLASLHYAETRPALLWLLGGLAVAGALLGHAVVAWKMERDYRRR